MKITIQEYKSYDAREILSLYSSVEWRNYTEHPDMLRSAFENSLLTLGAYDGDQLLGIIRTVGDGFSVVFIQDILVYPEHQGQGVGTALVKAVLERYSHVYQIELLADNTPKTVAFYESLGFHQVARWNCCAFIK